VLLNNLAGKEPSGFIVYPVVFPACETAAIETSGPPIFPADKATLVYPNAQEPRFCLVTCLLICQFVLPNVSCSHLSCMSCIPRSWTHNEMTPDLDLVRESYTMVECKNMLYVRQAHTKMRLFFRDTDTLEMFDQTNTVVQSDV
jgi:hypothetical protein